MKNTTQKTGWEYLLNPGEMTKFISENNVIYLTSNEIKSLNSFLNTNGAIKTYIYNIK